MERERARLAAGVDRRPLAPDDALRGLADDARVLFVCLGNICRSPMAERYAARRVAAAGADVDVASAGFVEREGRSSPDAAVEVAAEFGVDLSAHRSTHVTRGLLAESDLVFVMDADNYRRLRSRFPDAVDRAYFLGAVGDHASEGWARLLRTGFEIPDPVDGDHETFRAVYGDVADAVDRVLARAGVVEA